MATKSIIDKKIKKKAEKIVKDTLDNIREELAFQIEEHFELYIDRFYAHYPEPRRYERTGSTYYASDSYKDFTSALVRDGNRVGIIVSSENIPGNPYYVEGVYGMRKNGEAVDKEWVFNNTFALGRHGYPPYEGKTPMSPSPLSNMTDWFIGLKTNKNKIQNKIKEEALSKAIAKNL